MGTSYFHGFNDGKMRNDHMNSLNIRAGALGRGFAAVLVVALSGCSLQNAWRTMSGPSDATYTEGRLVECPDQPNCISTQTSNPMHAVVPFTYSQPLQDARVALKQEMSRVSCAQLVKEDGAYLHFECRSPVLRLIDDVEFLFSEESKTLQFRSAARFGYSDWNRNRKRMEDLRHKILGRI